MKIIAENIGKKFTREWIFRNLNLSFEANKSYAITGPNGSGKSTLLQLLTGSMPLTEGKLIYQNQELEIHPDNYFKHLSIATPYQELIEEFTLAELISFHLKFKSFKAGIDTTYFYQKTLLSSSANKEIRYFSSGMKQRVKLALAMYSKSDILFLDEPTSNLDQQGIDWYISEINQHLFERVVIICSNQKYEYDFCDKTIFLNK